MIFWIWASVSSMSCNCVWTFPSCLRKIASVSALSVAPVRFQTALTFFSRMPRDFGWNNASM